jgi:O-antigen/teichoic acid export membrane protein
MVLMNVLPALMIPIYTYRVPPSVYGVLELLNRSQEILLLILSFGLRSALLTFYQMCKHESGREKAVYSTALQFLCSFGLVLILIMMFGAGMWSRILFGTRAYAGAVLLILVATYFETVFQMAVLYLQSELRSVIYVSIFTTRALVAIALNLVFVSWLRWGLIGILWATTLHTTFYALAVVVYMFRRTGLVFDRNLLQEMLRFGAPLMVGAFPGFLLNSGDRYFLNHYRTPAEVGLYGLGYRIGILCTLLVLMPFGKIWSVTLVDVSKKADGPFELGKIATYLLFVCTFSTLGFSLLGPYMIRVLSQRSYWDAYRVIPIVGAAYILYGWTVIMDASFYVTKRTIYKIYSASVTGAIVMLLYWWLIPLYGMMGAAWATLGGYASLTALTAFYAQRVYLIHYQMKRLTLLFVGAVVFYEVGSLIPITPVLNGVILRSLVTLGFPVALWLGGFLKDDERRFLKDYWMMFRLRYLGGAEV